MSHFVSTLEDKLPRHGISKDKGPLNLSCNKLFGGGGQYCVMLFFFVIVSPFSKFFSVTSVTQIICPKVLVKMFLVKNKTTKKNMV